MSMSSIKRVTGILAAAALCFSPTMASAASYAAPQPMNPLIAVSVFGTPASAQAACSSAANAAAQAGAAVAAQGQANCVLPAVDPPPPAPIGEAVPPPPSAGFGIGPILLGLLGIAALAALLLSGDGDDDDEVVSPG